MKTAAGDAMPGVHDGLPAKEQPAKGATTLKVADRRRAVASLDDKWNTQPNTRLPRFQVPNTTPSNARPSNGVF